MTEEDQGARVRELLLRRFGLRVQPEMGQYVAGQLRKDASPRDRRIAVMGGDARTGIAVRQLIAAADLLAPSAPGTASATRVTIP